MLTCKPLFLVWHVSNTRREVHVVEMCKVTGRQGSTDTEEKSTALKTDYSVELINITRLWWCCWVCDILWREWYFELRPGFTKDSSTEGLTNKSSKNSRRSCGCNQRLRSVECNKVVCACECLLCTRLWNNVKFLLQVIIKMFESDSKKSILFSWSGSIHNFNPSLT